MLGIQTQYFTLVQQFIDSVMSPYETKTNNTFVTILYATQIQSFVSHL